MPIRQITPPRPAAGGAGGQPPEHPPVAASTDGERPTRSRKDRTGPNWNEDGSYKVGKGKPPLNRSWQPGQSGNPKGPKKKEMPDVETIVAEMMEETIVLTLPGGTKRKVTHVAALMRKTFEKAIKGDLKAAVFLLESYAKHLARKASIEGPHGGLSAAEEQIVAQMLKGFLGGSDEHDPS